jgi:hypothetical protein
VRDSGVLSRASVCRIFGIDTAQITDHVEFDPALAIKFTIYRRMPSGSPDDADIFGSQPEYRDAVGRSDEIRRCELPPKSTAIRIFYAIGKSRISTVVSGARLSRRQPKKRRFPSLRPACDVALSKSFGIDAIELGELRADGVAAFEGRFIILQDP